MRIFNSGESYSSKGIYVPYGYIERENNGAINAGLSFGASTPHIGPYAEGGYYVENTWEPDGSHSFGHGTYTESGMFFGDEVGGYVCKGKCWDSRDGKTFGSTSHLPKMPLPKLSYPSQPSNNDISEIARRVYRGDYGNGMERKRRLEQEGYNYREIQNYVNKKYYK